MRLDMLPATYGDCLVLSYGSSPERYILIDTGTTPTWKNHLRPYVEKAGIKRFELFVLTHVDADHIAGAIPMLEDEDLPFEIGEVWFNGWDQLPKNVLSVKQGERFSELIRERNIPWNQSFGGKAVCVDNEAPQTLTLPGNLRLTVLSPTADKLSRLARVWKKTIDRQVPEARALGKTNDRQTPYTLMKTIKRPFISATPRRRRFLARNPTMSTDVPELAATRFKSDTSVPNGSSIALLAKHGRSSVLLAGDAYAPVLYDSITKILNKKKRLRVGAFKVSHHGSRGNISKNLLELLNCDKYLISCNGDVHKLPDNEAIGRIIQYGAPTPRLFFNYHCERTQCWDDNQLRRKYGYRTEYGQDGLLSIEL